MNARVPLDHPFIRTSFSVESQPASSSTRATLLHSFQLNYFFVHNFGGKSVDGFENERPEGTRSLCALLQKDSNCFCIEALLKMEFST